VTWDQGCDTCGNSASSGCVSYDISYDNYGVYGPINTGNCGSLNVDASPSNTYQPVTHNAPPLTTGDSTWYPQTTTVLAPFDQTRVLTSQTLTIDYSKINVVPTYGFPADGTADTAGLKVQHIRTRRLALLISFHSIPPFFFIVDH
jgi:hypothetical protein